MSALLEIAFIIAAGYFLGKRAERARSGAWAGPQTKGQRSRATAGMQADGGRRRSLGGDLKAMTHQAALTNWLEGHRHDRTMAAKNGGSYIPTTSPTPPPGHRFSHRFRPSPDGGIRQVIPGFAQRVPAAANSGANGSNPQTGGESPPGSAPAQPQSTGSSRPPFIRPGRPVPPPPQASSPATPSSAATARQGGNPSTEGTAMSAGTGSTGAVEQLVEGINRIHNEAQAGGIHAKLAALKASHEACVRFAAMAQMLSRQMSEPGSNYGREITEPVGQAGTNLQAAAMSWSEADAALSSLINMNVGELATSARQAPHHSELSESGSR